MAVKANNIMSFRSDQVNTTVHLVRRSVGKYRTPGKKPGGADLIWWRGQLAQRWRVWFETAPGVFEWCSYGKGQIVWFDAELFHQINTGNMDTVNLSNHYIGSIDLDVLTAMAIIAQIQLAARHPKNNGATKEIAEKFARELQAMVTAVTPENSALMEKGWNPDFDEE